MTVTILVEPCVTCGRHDDSAKRLHQVACAGLDSHRVFVDVSILDLSYRLAHRWRDEKAYSAVRSERPLSYTDAFAWLERVHDGEVERRPWGLGAETVFDVWED